MDVLVIHNSYRQRGGEDEVFHAEVELLRSRGHRVVTYRVSNDLVELKSRASLAAGTIWSSGSYAAIRKLIRSERPQLAHVHNTLPLISPAAYYAVKREGLPVVQTLHNYRLLCPAGTLFRNGAVCTECIDRKTVRPAVSHRCYRDSAAASATVASMLEIHRLLGTWTRSIDIYIALTQWSRNLFISAGIPSGKIVVKPNFVFPVPADTVRTHGGGRTALFAGRLAPEKGVRTMLRAWREIGNRVPLTIAGDGPMGQEVSEAAREIPGVTWLGAIPKTQLYERIADSGMLLAPSEWYETFGLVVLEAFALSVPVIASRIGALQEVVTDGKTGLHFEPGDHGQLAAAVLRMASNDKERTLMGESAKRVFEERYSAEVNYGVLMDAYRRAIGTRSRFRINDFAGNLIPGVRYHAS